MKRLLGHHAVVTGTRILAGVVGVILLGIGLATLIMPEVVSTYLLSLTTATGAGINSLRGDIGALFLGIGLFSLLGVFSRQRWFLLVPIVFLALVVLGRLISIAVEDFAAFAAELARRYGDRVEHWMVFNEPTSVLGHTISGLHTRYGPNPVEALKTIHHINLACAEAGRRMRDVLADDARIGTANVTTVASPLETDDPKLRRAQRAYE